MNIQSITEDMVFEVYKGEIGCMCGCKGKYYTTRVREANDQCGYPYHKRKSPAKVKEVLNVIKGADPKSVEVFGDPHNFSLCFDNVQTNTRYLIRLVGLTEVNLQSLGG